MIRKFDLTQIHAARRKVAQQWLKRCPVCETLHAQESQECWVCGWHGGFLQDGESVDASLQRLIESCPEFVPVSSPKLGVWGRLWRALKGPFDLRA